MYVWPFGITIILDESSHLQIIKRDGCLTALCNRSFPNEALQTPRVVLQMPFAWSTADEERIDHVFLSCSILDARIFDHGWGSWTVSLRENDPLHAGTTCSHFLVILYACHPWLTQHLYLEQAPVSHSKVYRLLRGVLRCSCGPLR